MMTNPDPGDQPDTNDAADCETDRDASNPATTDRELAAEAEAARLGDFA